MTYKHEHIYISALLVELKWEMNEEEKKNEKWKKKKEKKWEKKQVHKLWLTNRRDEIYFVRREQTEYYTQENKERDRKKKKEREMQINWSNDLTLLAYTMSYVIIVIYH